ncbi:DNA polymerase III subunit beta [Buchnera aphidicola]|uniref:Beta sliding clamp n=1 Tax=Buchnera aphidicola (Anoecia oenotherae) TaxID=1241833 RepID=A0A4D6Y3X7_9GAMM|nr:DNA polymerase III subunit beta [Buchnera aphidicola]QCI19155.1 DNA polymerase III subunit beta [Buchnera aphidicola (Anoecia oenotherae)]
MKLTIHRDLLLSSVKKVISIVAKNPTMVVIENILIKLQYNRLVLISTNLDIEITSIINSFSSTLNFEFITSGRKLLEICRVFPKDSKMCIRIKKNSNRIVINYKNSYFKLCTMSSENFPLFKDIKKSIHFSISKETFRYLVESIVFSMGNNDIRHYLNGMLFLYKDNKLETVATDGHRMALVSIEKELNISNFSIIISRKAILEIIKIVKENKGSMVFNIDYKNIFIQVNNTILKSKLIDGKFPNYTNLVLNNFCSKIEINTKLLKLILSRALILSDEQFNGVHISINDNKLIIVAKNSFNEISKEFIEINYSGNPIEFGVNVKYMLDVLNVILGENIIIFLNNPINNIHIQDKADSNLIYIIMPLIL